MENGQDVLKAVGMAVSAEVDRRSVLSAVDEIAVILRCLTVEEKAKFAEMADKVFNKSKRNERRCGVATDALYKATLPASDESK